MRQQGRLLFTCLYGADERSDALIRVGTSAPWGHRGRPYADHAEIRPTRSAGEGSERRLATDPDENAGRRVPPIRRPLLVVQTIRKAAQPCAPDVSVDLLIDLGICCDALDGLIDSRDEGNADTGASLLVPVASLLHVADSSRREANSQDSRNRRALTSSQGSAAARSCS